VVVAAVTFVLVLAVGYWMDVPQTNVEIITPPIQITPSRMQVVDGDTIQANGLKYRLVGFDTAETIDAKCPQERVLGERAAARLRAIVSQGGLDLTEVKCACAPGTHGTRFCNHGRRCAALKANGQDVGQMLIREGLARPFVCGRYSCPGRQPWC
jgi:endonuclease YncB( thermonuclease family)